MLSLNLNKLQSRVFDNYDSCSLIFSNYKNTIQDKSPISIAPHGMCIHFCNIYSGSISDYEITAKTNILDYVDPDREIMSDRVFVIKDLCKEKGIYSNISNRPKQKDQGKFLGKNIQKNFDISSTGIYLEQFIGRVRNFKILNNVWLMNQIGLLSSTWQTLCHVVNKAMPPIGPRY